MVFYNNSLLLGALSATTFPTITSSQNVPLDIGSVMQLSSLTTTSSHLTRAVSDACLQEVIAIGEAGWDNYFEQDVFLLTFISSSYMSCYMDENPFDACNVDLSSTNSKAYDYCLSLGGSLATADQFLNSEGCPLATGMEPVTISYLSFPACGGSSCTTADLEDSYQDPNSDYCEQSIVNAIAWTSGSTSKSSKSSKKSAKVSSKSPKLGKSLKVRNLRL